MISASKTAVSLNNLKILRPKVMKNLTNLPKKFCESPPWCKCWWNRPTIEEEVNLLHSPWCSPPAWVPGVRRCYTCWTRIHLNEEKINVHSNNMWQFLACFRTPPSIMWHLVTFFCTPTRFDVTFSFSRKRNWKKDDIRHIIVN